MSAELLAEAFAWPGSNLPDVTWRALKLATSQQDARVLAAIHLSDPQTQEVLNLNLSATRQLFGPYLDKRFGHAVHVVSVGCIEL